VNSEANPVSLPDDSQALKAMLRTLMRVRDDEKQRANKHEQRAEEQTRRANDLQVENLRLQLELDRFRKWYYGLALIGCNLLVTWRRCCLTSPRRWTASRLTWTIFQPAAKRKKNFDA
jgi:hypothetical protein